MCVPEAKLSAFHRINSAIALNILNLINQNNQKRPSYD